jgi:hypothetical protein
MKRALALASCLCLSCSRGEPPAALFDCRVPVEPLLVKLKAGGGDPNRIVRPRSADELSRLESGKRYRFVTRSDGSLAIAPLPADAPGNEYVHPVLGEGAPVLTAGGVRVDRADGEIRKVTVDQDSKSYCPTGESLGAALRELSRIGVPADRLRVENRPPECVGATPVTVPVRYGAVMAEVGLRFERMGRAAEARRFELAAFELDELGEVFAEDLPRAEPPRESQGVNLQGVAQAFRETNLPELDVALKAKDGGAFRAAYARAAETCNGCHRVSGHVFVEVSRQPGRAVPLLDPVR